MGKKKESFCVVGVEEREGHCREKGIFAIDIPVYIFLIIREVAYILLLWYQQKILWFCI